MSLFLLWLAAAVVGDGLAWLATTAIRAASRPRPGSWQPAKARVVLPPGRYAMHVETGARQRTVEEQAYSAAAYVSYPYPPSRKALRRARQLRRD